MYYQVVIDLAALRRTAGVTQVQLAERLGVGQGQISRTERQADLLLSTLVAYLRALGVDADLIVRLPNGDTICQQLTAPREEDR